MISLLHFDSVEPDFADQAADLLTVLAARPGYLRGSLARSTDDAAAWVLLTEWADVGSYRRSLGADVRVRFMPLLGAAADRPSAYEPLVDVQPGGDVTEHHSDRAPDSIGTQS